MSARPVPGPGFRDNPIIAKVQNGSEAVITFGRDEMGWYVDIQWVYFRAFGFNDLKDNTLRLALWPELTEQSYPLAQVFARRVAARFSEMRVVKAKSFTDPTNEFLNKVILHGNTVVVQKLINEIKASRDNFARENKRVTIPKAESVIGQILSFQI